MSSFIGCKISLISKAGIRYEGILYTIDPRESTVALSKVKSFGTEDRKMDRIIPPRDEIYEYIIFRGSDIQDLNVCEPSKESSLLSEDSAIVRAETSISGNLPPGVMSSGMHHIDNAWPIANNRMQIKNNDNKPIMINNSKSIGNSIENVQQNSTSAQMSTNIGSNRLFNQISNDNIKKQQQYRKNDLMQKPENVSATTAINNNDLDTRPRYEQNRSKSGKIEKPQKYSEKYNSNYHYDYEYNYDNNYKYQGNNYRVSCDYGPSRDYYHMKQTGRYRNDYRRDNYYSNMDAANKLRGFESSEGTRDYSYAQYYDFKPRNGHEKYSNNYDNNPKSKKKSPRDNETSKKDETFKEDYDFETANAIIAKELAALNVSQEKKDLKDDDCEKEDGQLSDNSEAGYYDKTKSFFDNISSEMMDRANGKSVRQLNRKEERKINVETFGIAEANRNLGRNSSKWNRNNYRHYSKSYQGGGGVPYRGNGTEAYKRESAYKTTNSRGGNGSGSGAYNLSRRPVLADGPAGRGGGDDY